MKILFDFLPIALFFGMFKYAEGQKEWAAETATQWLGFMVSGGVVGPAEAPVLLATVVVIVATLAQIIWLKARGKKVETMLWISLALVTVLGGALLIGQVFFQKNFIKSLMGAQMELPDSVWRVLNCSWAGFFAVMGVLNLWVAFNFNTDTWVNFKLFGGMGLMVLFVIVQALYLSKYMKSDEAGDA